MHVHHNKSCKKTLMINQTVCLVYVKS